MAEPPGPGDEIDTGPRVVIVRNGPMLVHGLALGRLRQEGERWSIDPVGAPDPFALCRCGRSSAMPFCERSAPYSCFEEQPTSGLEPAPFGWDIPDPSRPGIAIKPNGPVRLAGPVPVIYDGDEVPRRDRVSLCRCGASRCQPVCDSSHKIVGFHDDEM
jgi:CDGSH-type Zn-finger protein